MVGIAVAGLCLLEAVLSLAFYIDDRMTWKAPDTRFEADTYNHAPWAFDYYQEYASIATNWQPYVYWRRAPYRGRFINVNERGLRATTPAAPEPGAVKIFMFGGSTMWGTGARDAFTIPSLVARELRQRGVIADVTNFGESGYVSTQSVLALEHELRQGHRPDLVVVYDGINDTYSAYQQGVAGWPQNEDNRARDFNPSLADRVRRVAKDLGVKSQTRRFLLHFTPARNASSAARPEIARPAADDRLAQEVIRIFSINMEMIRTLGRQYGFDSVLYWQPTILDKPHLTAYEQAYRTEMKPMEPFFARTYDIIRRGSFEKTHGLHDLSPVFATTEAPVFLDSFHLGETGNELIAKAMLPDILRTITARAGQAVKN